LVEDTPFSVLFMDEERVLARDMVCKISIISLLNALIAFTVDTFSTPERSYDSG
jgi:hypothetical protein